MAHETKVLVIDGYIDDPASLGVPPYISPMARAVFGAALDAGACAEYVTVDMIRKGLALPDADVTAVLSGNTVPGKYLRSMPMSLKELAALAPRLGGFRIIGGSAASSRISEGFDLAATRDLAASVYDAVSGRGASDRLRSLGEWNEWMVRGAEAVRSHPDFPMPLIAEVETYRGCHRHLSGGCSFCVEPLKGRPLARAPGDVIAEASRLRALGVRNLRVGGQTCIVSYGADEGEVPRPDPGTVRELFEGLRALGFEVLHVDNANPAVISTHPEESERAMRSIAECCTPGNVLALGLESADPEVRGRNNLNSSAEQAMDAVRAINRIGRDRGANGMPNMLPGLNFVCGLDGETASTYKANMDLLRSMLSEGLLLRRINIRQVMPSRREFRAGADQRSFRRFKEAVRGEIDREMLARTVPVGTVLRGVYMEVRDGNSTFGRQIGSYPLLVGVPYKMETEEMCDVLVTGHGFRSVTGVGFPFDVNSMPLSAIEALPGIGRKRAARIVTKRPYASMAELAAALDDPAVADGLEGIARF
ncbi:MAG: radical SAM protein [Candidatus Methanoplasma sp.]|jgi:radical SAM superfamily enzyme with C-terminal helix-hairpin-helix motif|nr:radical SAM protein [Candidatus Methanoplasma sp.]